MPRPAKSAIKSTRTAKIVKTEPKPQVQRKRKVAKYKSFRLQKKIPHPAGPIPSSWQLLGKTRRLIWFNKKPLLLLIVAYLFLNFALVRGFTSPLNVGEVKSQLSNYVGGNVSKADTTAAVFSALVKPDTGVSDSSGVYQTLLLIIFGLAIVWLYRQSATGNKPTARSALYKGMYPLVPLILVIVVMSLEFLPAILGSGLFSATVSSGIAASGYEVAIWTILSGLLILLSFYLLFSSLFAVYIVTLPDMTPIKALRSARQIVFSRRLNILRRLVILLIAFILLIIIVIVPAIYFAAAIAPWIYFVLSILGALFVHSYLFTLYKELL